MKRFALFWLLALVQFINCDEKDTLKESIAIGKKLFKEYIDHPDKSIEKEEVRKLMLKLFSGEFKFIQ